ncbi:MAG: hypothetical protein WKF91_20035, partial [Segetibacter sp.]
NRYIRNLLTKQTTLIGDTYVLRGAFDFFYSLFVIHYSLKIISTSLHLNKSCLLIINYYL